MGDNSYTCARCGQESGLYGHPKGCMVDWTVADSRFPDAAPMWDCMWRELGQPVPEVSLRIEDANGAPWLVARMEYEKPPLTIGGHRWVRLSDPYWIFRNDIGWLEKYA